MKEGDKVNFVSKDFNEWKRKKTSVLKTSEAVFIGFHGPKTALLEFTRPDGSKLRRVVNLAQIQYPPAPPLSGQQ